MVANPRHRSDEERARLADEFGVDEVYVADLPVWWLRLTAPLAISWRRELAFWGLLLGVGVLVGFVFGRA